MRVFVTGGTGAIGSYAVPALVAAGHTVSALVRNETKARTVHDQSATPVMVSLFDRQPLRSLRVSNARFRSATTWKPQFPSVREGYRAMANARN